MSSLWTPGGEHPVEPSSSSSSPSSPPPSGGEPTPEEVLASLSPEEREQAEQMVAELTEQLRSMSGQGIAIVKTSVARNEGIEELSRVVAAVL